MKKGYLYYFIFIFGVFFAFMFYFNPSYAFAAGTVYDSNSFYESGTLAVSGGSISCVPNGIYHDGNYLLFTPSDVTSANMADHYMEFKINVPVASTYAVKGVFHMCSEGGIYGLSINGTDYGYLPLNNNSEMLAVISCVNGQISLPKGENTFRIYLLTTNKTLCGFDTIELTNSSPQPLDTPTGLSWNYGFAQWSADSNASGYRLQLYKDGSAVGSSVTVSSGSSYNFLTEIFQSGTGTYTFTVTSIGDDNYFKDSSPATVAGGHSYYHYIALDGSTNLPDAMVNSPYSFTFSTNGGYSNKLYSFTGVIPDGMHFSPSGILSGTPLCQGSYSFEISVTDGTTTDTKPFYLTVNQPVTLLNAVADGHADTATSSYISLTFDNNIAGFTADDIAITDGTGSAVKGTLSGSGTSRRLSLSQVTVQGNILLNITSPTCFAVSGSPVTVAVYKYKPSDNASLSDLKIGGNTVSGFAAGQYAYSLDLPYGTKSDDAVAQISAVKADSKAAAVVSQADHFPGDAVVTVTAEDGLTIHSYTVHLRTAADTAPIRKTGVADHTAADVFVNQAYTLKLTDLFRDVNAGETLNYKVSINGAAYIPAEEAYSYTPAAAGLTTLRFIANDGTMDSTDTYTVSLNAAKPKYKLTIKAGNGGSIITGADGNYEAGAVIPISANAQANYSFAGWTSSNGGSFGENSSSTTAFVMPAQATTVMAAFTYVTPSSNNTSSQASDNTLPTLKGNSINGWNAIKEYLADCTTGSFTVDMNGNTRIPKDLLNNIQGKDIRLTIKLTEGIEWIINGRDIPAAWQEGTEGNTAEQAGGGFDKIPPSELDLQIALDTHHISEELINGLAFDGEAFRQLSLTHEGSFGFSAVLHINLNQSNKGKVVYLYYYNPGTNKLELQSVGQIDGAGSTEFTFRHASDYVILMDNGNDLIKRMKQTAVTPSRKTLYFGGTKDNTAVFSITYPQEIAKLMEDGGCTGSVIYTSSDPKTAAVTSEGKITALKKGKTTVTAAININGTVISFPIGITIKKAAIRLKKYTEAMNKGEAFCFQAKGYGIDAAEITWSSAKKSVIVINKKTGKALAKAAGTCYISAKAGDVKTKIKVVVK